jgi:hypothetical protein
MLSGSLKISGKGYLKISEVRRVVCCDQGAVPATAWRAMQLECVNCGIACPLAGV